jgi:hypothetical protein
MRAELSTAAASVSARSAIAAARAAAAVAAGLPAMLAAITTRFSALRRSALFTVFTFRAGLAALAAFGGRSARRLVALGHRGSA